MITALDTNVLIDVLTDDKNFSERSLLAIQSAEQMGQLVVCEIVLAETARYFSSFVELTELFNTLHIAREQVGEEACYLAGQTFLAYRRRQKGPRDRILPDFLIASHAQIRCSQLITRDRGFYRTYFPKLHIIDPSE